MTYVFIFFFCLGLLVWVGRRAQRKQFLEKKAHYKRPIWNFLQGEREPCSCAEINMGLEKIVALPEIADVELRQILDEMVHEGTLESKSFNVLVGGSRIREVHVTKYAIMENSSPPSPTPRKT